MNKDQKDKKSRRRGSQAFTFEQSEETLLQSETLQNLYKNKNYVAPQPKEMESIQEVEEHEVRSRSSGGQEARSRREKVVHHELNNEKRFLEPYKFWRVDDKERNKRRKMMVQKLWKGRRRPKASILTEEQELMLEQMLDLKEATFQEEQESEETLERNKFWSEILPAKVEKKSTRVKDSTARGKKRKKQQVRKGIVALESSPGEDDSGVADLGGGNLGHGDLVHEEVTKESERVAHKDDSHQIVSSTQEMDTKPPASPTPPAAPSVDDSLSSLASFIPADELAEMLGSEDLLFCQEPKIRKQGEQGSRRSGVKKKGKESLAKSVRRSARLSIHPNLTGSIFTEEQEAAERSKEQEMLVSRGKEQEVPSSNTRQGKEVASPIKEDAHVGKVPDSTEVIPSNPATPVVEETSFPSFNNCVAPLKMLGRSRSRLKQEQRETEAVLQDISNKVQREGGGRSRRQGTKQEIRRSEEMQQDDDGSCGGLPPYDAEDIVEANRRSCSKDGSRRSR